MKKKKKQFLDGNGGEEAADALSPEEIEMLKASMESAKVDRSKLPPHDTSDRAMLVRFIKKNLPISICALFVAVTLIIGAVSGCVILASKVISVNRPYTYEFADKKPEEYSAREVVIDGVLYVDMMRIAECTKMIISGTESRVQFTSVGNTSSLLFEDGKDYALINGGRTILYGENMITGKWVEVTAKVSADSCLVPFSFLAKAIDSDTLRLEFKKDTNTVLIKPKYISYTSDPDTLYMKNVLFITDNFDVTMPEKPRPSYEYFYSIDVSQYIGSITAEHLLLANKTSSLGAGYEPPALTKLTCATAPGRTFELQYDAAEALYAMMLDMEQAGVADVYVTSAYRSYAYQENLYRGYVEKHMAEGMTREEAEREASSYSARPGESEHQTGLCLDFTTSKMGGQLNESFEKTDAFKWLSQNAYKYGFILRYPKDKVALTGYDYEPWHYRFVGRQAASEMREYGQCLEEYLEMAPQN